METDMKDSPWNGCTPIAGWNTMENPRKIDDLRVPPILGHLHISQAMIDSRSSFNDIQLTSKL
jgi:hypothetical protein